MSFTSFHTEDIGAWLGFFKGGGVGGGCCHTLLNRGYSPDLLCGPPRRVLLNVIT